MAGWNFFNKGSQQAEEDNIPPQQGGHRISQFTGQAVPAIELNLGAPPPGLHQPLPPTPPTNPPSAPEPPTEIPPAADTITTAAADPAPPNADMTALYPTGATDSAVEEDFFIAPPTGPATLPGPELDDTGFDAGMDLGLGGDLSLGEPLDAATDNFDDTLHTTTEADPTPLPMVDLSTGSVVDEPTIEPTENVEPAPELLPLETGTELAGTDPDAQEFLQDIDPPFDITHDDVGAPFDEIGQGATAQLLDVTPINDDVDMGMAVTNDTAAEDDDFLLDNDPSPTLSPSPLGDDTTSDDVAIWDDLNTANETPPPANTDAFLDGFEDTTTPSPPINEGLEGFDLGDDLSFDDATADGDDAIWGLNTPTETEAATNHTANPVDDTIDDGPLLELSAPDANTITITDTIELHNTTYLETAEEVALSSEDMAAFYPQHHELDAHGMPASSVVLPPDTPVHHSPLSQAPLPASHIADAPLDMLDTFTPDDDDWALDAIAPADVTLAPLTQAESAAIVASALPADDPSVSTAPIDEPTTTPPSQGEWFEDDGFSLSDDTTTLPMPTPIDGPEPIERDDTPPSPPLETPVTHTQLHPSTDTLDAAVLPLTDSAIDAPSTTTDPTPEPLAPDPVPSAETIEPEPVLHTESVPEPEPITDPDTYAPLFTRNINPTLTVSLTQVPNAREKLALWATNPTSGQQTELKTLPLGLLPADTNRIRVSPEARLKNKTIYRVDLVRWKGLFSQSDDGSFEFRDELHLAAPNALEPSHA